MKIELKRIKNTKISQVFLWDPNIKKKIGEALKNNTFVQKSKNIIEVGVGRGEMTKILINYFPTKTYIGIEIDKNLSEIVKTNFQIELINDNYLKTNLETFGDSFLFSSIPYHLTTKFLEHFILKIKKCNLIVIAFIMQKETFRRLLVDNKRIFYAFREFFSLQKKMNVKRQCFKPIPHIDSVFSIWYLKKSRYSNYIPEYLECIRIFNKHRSKNITNNIKDMGENNLLNRIDSEIAIKKFLKLTSDEQKKLLEWGIRYLVEKKNNA